MPHNQAIRPYPTPPGQDIRYEHEIRLLEGLNRSERLPDNPVLFTGSSIFRFWSTLAHDMEPLPVVNRAFGGARTWEVLHFFDRIIMPCRPGIIAYYCGSNDIECGEEPEGIAERFEAFGKRVLDALPLCRIFFISINLAPQKRARWDAIQEANRLAANLCEKTPSLSYIDVNPGLLDAHGQPRSTLYQEDGLHLRPAAYQELSAIIKPVLLQAWHVLAA